MNKGKQAIRKNSVKKQRPNRIKKTVRHGNRKKRRRISARANNSLTTVPQPTHMIEELILSYRNNFSLPQTLFEAGSWWSSIYHKFIYTFEEKFEKKLCLVRHFERNYLKYRRSKFNIGGHIVEFFSGAISEFLRFTKKTKCQL